MTRVTRNHPQTNSGNTTIRPMYGIVIRDSVAKFRAQISETLADTRKAIADGDGRKKAIPGNDVLEGAEIKKARLAVKDLEKALKALQPVYGSLGAAPAPATTRTDMGRPAGGGMIAMYGVVFRDDLRKFRTEINTNLMDIRAAINAGQLKGEAKAEAQKAVKYLESAVKDLSNAGSVWR